MSERQRETTFLRQSLRYEDSPEHQQLEERLVQLERKERSVQRAVWLMVLLLALAVLGLCYWAVFVTKPPRNLSEFITPFISRGFCELGVGAIICLVAFLGLGVIYRKQLARRRQECRRLAGKLLETRLGPLSRKRTKTWNETLRIVRACFENHVSRSSQRQEAQISASFGIAQSLLTSAATILI